MFLLNSHTATEDLHLDERIMQFLNIANILLSRTNQSSQSSECSTSVFTSSRIPYRARHYNVTPLGPRSGLIQWVEETIALFAIYKRWQQREAAAAAQSAQQAQQDSARVLAVPKPYEVFMAKIVPLLKQRGLRHVAAEDRSEWPADALLTVYQQLIKETPSDLIDKYDSHLKIQVFYFLDSEHGCLMKNWFVYIVGS